jgi:hypothetical protein
VSLDGATGGPGLAEANLARELVHAGRRPSAPRSCSGKRDVEILAAGFVVLEAVGHHAQGERGVRQNGGTFSKPESASWRGRFSIWWTYIAV